MNSAVSRTWLLLSNFLALPCSERILSSVALAQGLCTFFFSFTGLFLFPQLSVGITGAWGTHKKGDLQGDFTLSPACLVSKPWTGPPHVSPPTAAWQSELGGSLLVPAAAGHHGGGDLTLNSALSTSNSVHLDTGENLYAGCCQLSFGCK